ncbi:MAG: hypothetical protein Q8J74_10370 [Candidatus Didemnitutus sp.]|nr:hypothetical protein [Candidatus Didemnitutus sp.]
MNRFCMQVLRGGRLAAGLGLAAFLPAAAKEPFAGADTKWRRYESPNFELFSHNSDAKSRRLLHNLELLRGFFNEHNRIVERRPLGVTVYYFSNKSDFDAYKPDSLGQSRIAGIYFHGADRAAIMVAPSNDSQADQRLIFHEYVHHLIRTAGYDPPMWIGEGLAELYSTLVVKETVMELGRPVAGHLRLLNITPLLPFEDLVTQQASAQVFQRGDLHTGVFYAQSWALMHFLNFGATELSSEKVDRLLGSLLLRREPPDAAEYRRLFEEATGLSFRQLQERLDRYVSSGRYQWSKVPLPQVAKPASYTVTRVDLVEIRERLAELALRSKQAPLARLAMLEAASGPNPIRGLEVLGNDELRNGDQHQAQRRWEAAIAAGSRNTAIFSQVGVMESRRWFSSFDYEFRLPERKAEELRAMLQQSIAIAPDRVDAYEMLAWVEAFAPSPSVKNVNLVQRKFTVLDDKPRTMLALALVRLRVGDRFNGEAILAEVERINPDWETLAAVRSVRRHLAQLPDRPNE